MVFSLGKFLSSSKKEPNSKTFFFEEMKPTNRTYNFLSKNMEKIFLHSGRHYHVNSLISNDTLPALMVVPTPPNPTLHIHSLCVALLVEQPILMSFNSSCEYIKHLKQQKGRSWGCKFYEKIRSKHCKLQCFMASTCLKPR